MMKFALALLLVASPALAQQMTPAQMQAMGIGPAIQHGPRGRPLTDAPPLPPFLSCRDDANGKETCVLLKECRPGGPRPCVASPAVVKGVR